MANRFLLLSIALSLLGTADIQAQSTMSIERFREEAPRGWRVWQEWNSRIKCVGKFTDTSPIYPKGLQTTRTLIYRRFDDSALVEQIWPKSPIGSERVIYAFNPTYSFLIVKKKDGSFPWVLKELEHSQVQRTTIRDQIQNVYGMHVTPFTIPNVQKNLTDWMSDPGLSISKIESQGEFIKVSYEYKTSHSRGGEQKPVKFVGWLLFDPSNNWCLLENEFIRDQVKWHTRTTYAHERIGTCRPFTKVEFTRLLPSKPDEYIRETLTVESLTQEDTPRQAFTLPAYELPEPIFAATGRSWSWLWMLVLAVACALCGFLLKRQVRAKALAQ